MVQMAMVRNAFLILVEKTLWQLSPNGVNIFIDISSEIFAWELEHVDEWDQSLIIFLCLLNTKELVRCPAIHRDCLITIDKSHANPDDCICTIVR